MLLRSCSFCFLSFCHFFLFFFFFFFVSLITRLFDRTFPNRPIDKVKFLDADGVEFSGESLLGDIATRFIWVKSMKW
jgi:hypothetical protein